MEQLHSPPTQDWHLYIAETNNSNLLNTLTVGACGIKKWLA